MNSKQLFILTNDSGNIPQKLHETESLNIDVLKNYFIDKNWNVEIYTYDFFINKFDEFRDRISGSYFIYASSQYPDYYSSIDDILLTISELGGILIPKYTHFKAHENKFYQEFTKNILNLKTPKSVLLNTAENIENKISNLKYPIVAKLSNGFGSSGVQLIHSNEEVKKFINENLTDVVKPRKNMFKRKKQIEKYRDKYPLKVGKLIFQEFIIGLENDWKILVFGNKLFYLKRYFKENDFRASGSGNFDNSTPPSKELMKFAMEVKEKLDTPWVSLDIIEKGPELYLIEYQCVHFGLYTAMNSISHFEYNDGIFNEIDDKIDIDRIFTEELFNYISSSKE